MAHDNLLISFQDELGAQFRGALIHHHDTQIEFELYNPRATLSTNSTLQQVRIEAHNILLYQGPAHIQQLSNYPSLRRVRAQLTATTHTNTLRKAPSPQPTRTRPHPLRKLSHIAHELRTPLLSIRSASQGIGRYLPMLIETHTTSPSSPLSRSQLEALRQAPYSIERNIRDLNQLIDSLLDYSKQQHSSNLCHGAHSFSIHQCVQSALQSHPSWPQLKTLVQLHCDQDFQVHGSPQLMRHVIFNLLSNADAALDKDDSEINITLETGQHFNYLHFRDNGCGIAEDILPRIFDDYFSYRPNGQGTGLGLAFCRDSLLCMNGDIDCRSVAGQYTHFILRLPTVSPDTNQITRQQPDNIH